MTTREVPKVNKARKKPKSAPVVFEYLGLRPEVIVLLKQVEDAFEKAHDGIRPTHSATLVNALQAYKARLLAA